MPHPGAVIRPMLAGAWLCLFVIAPPALGAKGAAIPTEEWREIPAGPLAAVLSAFVAQTRLRVDAPVSLLTGRHSPGLRGASSLDAAVRAMLAGTGLDFRLRGRVLTLLPAVEDPARLHAVTVTGEKFERSLLETLSSVAVVTTADLADHGDRSLTDVMLRTPGVYAQSGNENWGVRGVPASGFDDQGPVTVNGAVAVQIDGVAQPHRAVTANPLPLWDVERIEMFRGAQSTLQGRNALAGAILIHTHEARHQPEFATRVSAGNHGQRGVALLAGGGLTEGVAARFTVELQETDGHIRNVTLNKDAFARRDLTARGKLRVQPNADLDMRFMLAHSDRAMGENAVAARNGEPLYYDIFYNTLAHADSTQDMASGRIDHFLGDGWTLTSETAGSRSAHDAVLDFDQSATERWEVFRAHANTLWSEELRVSHEGAALRAYAGLYVSTLSLDADDRLDIESANVLHALTDSRIRNRAVFGELSWDVSPRWQLIAGLRHDREDNDTRIRYPIDALGLAVATETTRSERFTALLPKVGAGYRLGEHHLVGFVAQRGYRAGGVHLRTADAHESYEPEFTDNHELSYRGVWPRAGVSVNANLYRIDWTDQQVRILDDNGHLRVVNAARSRLQGMEIAAEHDLDTHWRIAASAAWNDTEYRDFRSDVGDLSGRAFLFAPETKMNLGVTYRRGETLTANLAATWQSSSVSNYVTDDAGDVVDVRRNDSVVLLDATLAYRISERVRVSAFIKNATDARYIANNQSDDLLDVGAPRRIGVSLRLDW